MPGSMRRRIAGLLRFLTCGSVDDGKSTLIGRLLYDSAQVYEDQLEVAERDSKRPAAARAARSTFRFWSTASRPSASRASPSTWPIAISRRRGGNSSSPIRRAMCSTRATWRPARRIATSPCCWSMRGTACCTQTRRHACIVSLLGIRKVALAVNKMDLVDFDQARFDAIAEDFHEFRRAARLRADHLHPGLGAQGRQRDRARAPHMHWYHGPTLLGHLETVDVSRQERKTSRSASPCNG